MIPIACALISAVVTIRVTERPATFVYKEVPILENFNVLDYFPLKLATIGYMNIATSLLCWQTKDIPKSQILKKA